MKTVKSYTHHILERITLDDESKFILIKENNLFLLYDSLNNKPLGYISWGFSDGDVYSIYGAFALHGYGPLLYEVVMTYVYPNGITPSDETPSSSDALNVWKKFYERKDIMKEEIKRTKPTLVEIDYIDNCDGDIECLKLLDETFYLQKNKYIYTFGIDILNKMIKKGDKYLKEHDILDIQGMVYDLESLL